jgi:hypothetical protein
MKKLNRNRIQYQLVVTVLFLTQFVQAQPVFDDGDDVQDVPIDNWLLPMGVLGILLLYYFYKKQLISKIK